jgi:hypothetical protein
MYVITSFIDCTTTIPSTPWTPNKAKVRKLEKWKMHMKKEEEGTTRVITVMQTI